ncbi:hypothetical protein CBM2634_B190032 [Cupriavidus taiwanensis]|uniref:Uncharacterized protein n=1 Tax=Cupriavidus taiwanensis TaxID=164546 RepID=A0A375J7R6_9BURK|nr:hypothetical protein CBM2634_B190032 [Cupriavidus taiwanensis]
MSSEGLGKEAMGWFAGKRKGRAEDSADSDRFCRSGVTKRRRQHAHAPHGASEALLSAQLKPDC